VKYLFFLGFFCLFVFFICSSDADIVQEDNVKLGQAGEDVNLACTFSKLLQTTTTKPSDSATYYCVVSSYYTIGMGAGTRLLVKGIHIILQQSSIDKLHPGDSVSLQCSIFTESCAGEHSVYWFRQSLGESQGVLYTKGERNGQCENSTESQTQSCVYNLFKSNISHSDAGIYYCAVAACGEILFGKGTELNFRGFQQLMLHCLLMYSVICNLIFNMLFEFYIYLVACTYGQLYRKEIHQQMLVGMFNSVYLHYIGFSTIDCKIR
uniref:Uncharacterized LOC107603130 n=1 Tax=Sinocyclocheilus grahami TaxID=75366 RepID=A0A672QXE5_SINGR